MAGILRGGVVHAGPGMHASRVASESIHAIAPPMLAKTARWGCAGVDKLSNIAAGESLLVIAPTVLAKFVR